MEKVTEVSLLSSASKRQRRKGKIHPRNAEFQRTARRGKKAVLSGQCKTIERLEISASRDTKGTFHTKMGTIKDRNGMDLTEAEDITKRWQEYMEKLYKKDLHNPDNPD